MPAPRSPWIFGKRRPERRPLVLEKGSRRRMMRKLRFIAAQLGLRIERESRGRAKLRVNDEVLVVRPMRRS